MRKRYKKCTKIAGFTVTFEKNGKFQISGMIGLGKSFTKGVRVVNVIHLDRVWAELVNLDQGRYRSVFRSNKTKISEVISHGKYSISNTRFQTNLGRFLISEIFFILQ